MSRFVNYKKADSQQSGMGAFPDAMSPIITTNEPTLDAQNVKGMSNVTNLNQQPLELSSADVLGILKKIKP